MSSTADFSILIDCTFQAIVQSDSKKAIVIDTLKMLEFPEVGEMLTGLGPEITIDRGSRYIGESLDNTC